MLETWPSPTGHGSEYDLTPAGRDLERVIDSLGRCAIEWRHTAPRPETIWFVLERGAVSVCTQHPGFDVDLVVAMATADLADVFQGYRRWSDAVDSSAISVDGPPRLVAALPTWFVWSPWVDVTHDRAHRPVTAGQEV